jgi:hypothetical protein
MRRSDTAVKNNQTGTARQCLEKATGTLSAEPNPDEFITARKVHLKRSCKTLKVS